MVRTHRLYASPTFAQDSETQQERFVKILYATEAWSGTASFVSRSAIAEHIAWIIFCFGSQ